MKSNQHNLQEHIIALPSGGAFLMHAIMKRGLMYWNNRIPKLLTMLLLMFTLFAVVPCAQASSKIQGYVQTNVNLNLR